MAKASKGYTSRAPQPSKPIVHELGAEAFWLGSDRPGDSKAQKAARTFLHRSMVDHPNGVPGKTKRDFQIECEQQFEISNRDFDRIWREEIDRTGAIKYRKRGPRGPRRSRNN
jgi:hypothetical protein